MPTNTKELILGYLYRIYPRSATPKEIAWETKQKHDTVKKEMRRLAQIEAVVSEVRGYYRFPSTPALLREMEKGEVMIHRLKIEAHQPPSTEGGVVPYRLPLSESAVTYKDSYQTTYTHHWDGRPVKINVTGHGLIEIWLQASEAPLSYQDYKRYISFLEGMMPELWAMMPEVVQVELNCDFESLRLDGVKAVSLRRWENAWLRIYQKSMRARIECVWSATDHRLRMPVYEAMNLLAAIAAPATRREPDDMYL